ncbi:uncharacterized protein [Elaeis guineensis]|uniref:Uncharacterized protein LOC105041241 n=1 Tax=Elaeis guineensis var. tenera TaxID=51953 RepID=A0A6I9QY95_ELAGV|nr:uncharacterized protein LOC105041241 [Elaeis guineensis]
MAAIKGPRPGSNHQQFYSKSLFPELDDPVPFQSKDFSLPPMRRGSMYSVYAEIREWKLRRKKAEVNSMSATLTKRTATSSVSRSVPDFSMDFRKENRKPAAPLPPTGPRLHALMTPPRPMVPKAELRRLGSTPESRAEEKRGGNGLFERRKSYSCLKEWKECGVVASLAIDEEAKRGQSARKGIIKKTVSSFQQTTTWMG